MPAPEPIRPKSSAQLVAVADLKEGGVRIPSFGVLMTIDADKHKALMTMEPSGLRVEIQDRVMVVPYAHIKSMVVMP